MVTFAMIVLSQLPSFHSLRHINLGSLILSLGYTFLVVGACIYAGIPIFVYVNESWIIFLIMKKANYNWLLRCPSFLAAWIVAAILSELHKFDCNWVVVMRISGWCNIIRSKFVDLGANLVLQLRFLILQVWLNLLKKVTCRYLIAPCLL